MKKMTLNEIKKTELDMLVYVDKVCRENHINYSLSYGTMLGAIRHQGFIPWDDDIDIMLPIEDYYKLIKILKYDDKYKLMCDDSNEYYYWFAKLIDKNTVVYESHKPKDEILGVWIDIFPVIGISENVSFANYLKMFDKLNKDVFCSIKNYYYFDLNIFRKLIKMVLRFPKFIVYKIKGTEYYKNKRRELNFLSDFDKSDEVGIIPEMRNESELYSKSFFDNYIDVNFEGHKFKCIWKWDECLHKHYGDYMQLPPVEERVPDHFEAYYLQDEKTSNS